MILSVKIIIVSMLQMFPGNSDGDSVHNNYFEPPIIAQYIRIHPARWAARIAMRVELYGCTYGRLKIHILLMKGTCNQGGSK